MPRISITQKTLRNINHETNGHHWAFPQFFQSSLSCVMSFFSTWLAEKINLHALMLPGFPFVQMRPLILHITAHSGMLPPKFSRGTGESRRLGNQESWLNQGTQPGEKWKKRLKIWKAIYKSFDSLIWKVFPVEISFFNLVSVVGREGFGDP